MLQIVIHEFVQIPNVRQRDGLLTCVYGLQNMSEALKVDQWFVKFLVRVFKVTQYALPPCS